MIFGRSNVIGDLQDAIDNAFDYIKAIRDNVSTELKIIESTVFHRLMMLKLLIFLRNLFRAKKRTP